MQLSFTFLLPFFLLFIIVIPVLIGVFVYRDASSRGMNAVLWTLIAVLVPGLTGLIIYLIVRSSPGKRCINCGKQIGEDYRVCPYCSHNLELHCSQCGREVASEWKACPYCKHELQ